MALTLLRGADEALTLSGVVQKDGRHVKEEDLGLIKKPLVLYDNKKIFFVGPQKKFDTFFKSNKNEFPEIREKKITGHLIPGFVESHTHLVFAGDRKHEFEARNQGASYQKIAEQGGGIAFTMNQTKKASFEDLFKLVQERALNFKNQGVVLLEAKTGYGPDLKTELLALDIINKLKGIEVYPTYLGLHSVPNGMDKKEYVNRVINKDLDQVHKFSKVRHADIFLDKGYFNADDFSLLNYKLKKLGWSFSAHTDQLSATGAGVLAAQAGALSIGHCINMKAGEIQKVAKTNTVFNLLPAADFYLKINYPKAKAMIEAGGKVSLATDFNPGSSPTQNLNFVGVLARLEMKMSLAEVFAGYTFNAASALKMQHMYGAILPGYTSRFQILNKDWRDMFYQV